MIYYIYKYYHIDVNISFADYCIFDHCNGTIHFHWDRNIRSRWYKKYEVNNFNEYFDIEKCG
jgi:hypothetical protein